MPDNLPATLPTAPAPAFSVADIRTIGESIARSGLFGIKTVEQAVALCLIAQAEGRHPVLAARDYHIISGSPAKKAEAMLRDFLSSGGKVEWHRLDDECADATFAHPAGGSARIQWDQARVVKAQLGGNAMHKKYPRQMLRSRVVSEGVRTVWPMATSGMCVPEEVSEFAPSRQAPPIDITPKADLDRFAAPAEAVDAETGEVVEIEPLLADGDAAADGGKEGFTAWWNSAAVKPYRKQLRPYLERWEVIATAAEERGGPAPEEDTEDPFGLKPLPTASAPADRPGEDSANTSAPPQPPRQGEPSPPPPRDEAFWQGESYAVDVAPSNPRALQAELHRRMREARHAGEIIALRDHNGAAIDALSRASREDVLGALMTREVELRGAE